MIRIAGALAGALALVLDLCPVTMAACTPKKMIIETDFYAFSDDSNALGMANAFMSWGEVDIIGIASSIHSEYAPPAMDTVNTWYGHPDIPIAIKKPLNDSTRDWAYLSYADYVKPLISHFPENIHTGWNTSEPLTLYRKLLSESEDRSVTIAMIGFMDNLYDLVLSEPDDLSPLSGLELVQAKVSEMVVQGDPDAPSYNLDHVNGTYASHVLAVWPTAITFAVGDLGTNAQCCNRLTLDLDIETDPIAFVWNLTIGHNKTYYSWDPTAMLYAGRGLGNWYAWNKTSLLGYAVEANATTGDTYIDYNKTSPAPRRWIELASNLTYVELAEIIQDILLWSPREAWPVDAATYCSESITSTNATSTTSTAILPSSTVYTGEAAGWPGCPIWGATVTLGAVLASIAI